MTVNAFEAVHKGDINSLKAVISSNDINQKNSDGYGLLHEAISSRHDAVVFELLSLGINVNLQDNDGKTALSYAATYQNEVVVDRLVEAGADLKISDKFGNAPLWCALMSSRANYCLFSKILEYGADPAAKNKAGRSVIDFAIQTGNNIIMEIIGKVSRRSL